MINEKQTMYIAVIAIVLATIGIGLSYYKTVGPVGPAGATGPAGPAGPAGPVGPAGPQGASVTLAAEPESCVICHPDAGDEHQAAYDKLYQDGVIEVSDITYQYSSPGTHTVTFKMTKDGVAFDGTGVDSIGIYFAPYTGTDFEASGRMSLKGTLTYSASTGKVTSVLTSTTLTSNLGSQKGLIVIYGRDGTVASIPGSRVQQNMYPFAGLYETGGGIDYVSAANNDGCQKCHTTPYLKHGYIYGEVDHDPATDFYVCKACHLDNGEGGHQLWQLLVDNPALAPAFEEGTLEMTPEQEAQYAYKTSLMNDVHMSHAMEFPYPQSMSNCATCHEGKLDMVLSDDNFKVETCKSCHPVTGSADYGTDVLALKTILPSPIHDSMNLDTVDCTSCHSDGNAMNAPTFSEIHSGYDKVIYASADLKYSDAIVVTIDDASISGNVLDIKFSATETTDIAGINVANISPDLMVGLYGYDTKDFIQGPHERSFDTNNDGVVDRNDGRDLEYVVGEDSPRFTTISASGGSWEVKVDLSAWSSMISDGTVKRVEIGVMPALDNADGVQVALNAPSRTFDLTTNAFDDDFYSPIVKVTDGCNNCHDALATTFHSPDRGGNIVICRLCHITKSGGSHLEMQSRSIDSYVHAIHSMQAFDVGDIDFSDPVAALEYNLHTETPYPMHGIRDCESCHEEGAFNVPDQTKSLPGILSASDTLTGKTRDLSVPEYITGPATRACGGCHRAQMINEDATSELVSFYQHTKAGGYLIEPGDDDIATLFTVIDQIMAHFK